MYSKYTAHLGSNVTRYFKYTENINLKYGRFFTAGFVWVGQTLGQLGCFFMNWFLGYDFVFKNILGNANLG